MRRLFFGLILLTSVLACQPQPEQPFSVVNPGAVTLAPLPQLPETAVRGAWLTTTDSRVLDSRAGIEAAVRNCEALGINTLFVVVWGNGTTFYPSQIMQNLTGTSINARFAGRDPLRELIEVARPRGIKVFAWFEYGFAASFSAQGGALVRARPQWAALGTNGQLVVKNGFDWLNALDPEVQDFMLSLVLEVVRNYEVDGIQGDDRLPALPVEAGYNPAVAAAYRAETGQDPPPNFRDPAWVRWRAARLSGFAQRLYSQVKAARRNCLVAMSPSVFPFSREEYLQDWPTWVANGHADLLSPQVYRRDLESYAATLRANLALVPPAYRERFAPGVLMKVGTYQPTEALLGQMIEENRRQGLNGEVFFFYEGLSAYQTAFRERWYRGRATFPGW